MVLKGVAGVTFQEVGDIPEELDVDRLIQPPQLFDSLNLLGGGIFNEKDGGRVTGD
jgi:hypothetical protein